MREPDYRQIIREKMGDYRFTHSCNVAKEAVLLAKLYGGDEHKAYVAGILHDITKEIDGQEQLQIIRSYNGADTMREKSRRSLEEAMLFSCQFTLQKLSSQAAAIHPDQLACYNEIVLNQKG